MKIELNMHLPDGSTVVVDLLEAESIYQELDKLFRHNVFCSACKKVIEEKKV